MRFRRRLKNGQIWGIGRDSCLGITTTISGWILYELDPVISER